MLLPELDGEDRGRGTRGSASAIRSHSGWPRARGFLPQRPLRRTTWQALRQYRLLRCGGSGSRAVSPEDPLRPNTAVDGRRTVPPADKPKSRSRPKARGPSSQRRCPFFTCAPDGPLSATASSYSGDAGCQRGRFPIAGHVLFIYDKNAIAGTNQRQMIDRARGARSWGNETALRRFRRTRLSASLLKLGTQLALIRLAARGKRSSVWLTSNTDAARAPAARASC